MLREWMRFRHAHHKLLSRHGKPYGAPRLRRSSAQGKIDFPLSKQIYAIRRGMDIVNIEQRRAMGAIRVINEQLGQERLLHGCKGRHGDSGLVHRRNTGNGNGAIYLAQSTHDMGIETLTIRGQIDARVRTHKQLGTQFALQALNGVGKRGLCDAKLIGGMPEMPRLRDCREIA